MLNLVNLYSSQNGMQFFPRRAELSRNTLWKHMALSPLALGAAGASRCNLYELNFLPLRQEPAIVIQFFSQLFYLRAGENLP